MMWQSSKYHITTQQEGDASLLESRQLPSISNLSGTANGPLLPAERLRHHASAFSSSSDSRFVTSSSPVNPWPGVQPQLPCRSPHHLGCTSSASLATQRIVDTLDGAHKSDVNAAPYTRCVVLQIAYSFRRQLL